jgi:hypothetical protein
MTVHVRYEVLDDPAKPHPESPPDAYAWGVRAVRPARRSKRLLGG